MIHPARQSADSPSAIAAAIHLNVISAAMLLVQPAFVQGLVEQAGLDERSAGYVASAEMFGVAIGAAVVALGAARINWRTACIASVGGMAVLSAVSAAMLSTWLFMALRLLVGVGGGILMSISFAAIGKTSHPDRNFAWLVSCALTFGAVVVFAMPPLLEHIGLTGFLWLLSGYYATGLAAVRSLHDGTADHTQPSHPVEAAPGGTGIGISRLLQSLAVSAMFLYYIAQGAIWSYLALMGSARGLSATSIASSLTLSQLSGLGAVLLAAALANRILRDLALTIGILSATIALWALSGPQTALMYAVLVSLFNGAWNWTDPFLLGAMAAVDGTGRVMVWSIAWRLLGLALGPLFAALLLDGQDFSRVNALGITALMLALACIIPPLRALRRAGHPVIRP